MRHFGSDETFKVVVLGAHGGPRENNLSGYLLARKGANDFISLDAGSLLNGIYLAKQKNSFEDIIFNSESELNFEGQVLRNHIKAYLISHAHLDHVAGLVINSLEDSSKPIFGIDSTINFIRDHLFNWKIWPNFGSEGKKPLNKYRYCRMQLEKKIPIPNTEMSVEPFLLNHLCECQSTAFLIQSRDSYVLYFGDTSPDVLEQKKRIETIWKKITPIIQQNKLRCIFLECSYTDGKDQKTVFGHLDAKYLMGELNQLAAFVNPEHPSLNNCKVMVTHIKESLSNGVSSQKIIEEEIAKLNSLSIEFIFPQQGERIEF